MNQIYCFYLLRLMYICFLWTFNTSDSEVLRAESRVANKPKIAAANVAGEDRANHQRSSWFLTCFRHRGDNSCNVDVQQFATVLSQKKIQYCILLHSYYSYLLYYQNLTSNILVWTRINIALHNSEFSVSQFCWRLWNLLASYGRTLGWSLFPAGFGCVSSFLVAPSTSIEQRS